MSGWQDASSEDVARWSNLSTAQRIADLLGDISAAEAALRDVITFESIPTELADVDVYGALTIIRTLCVELSFHLLKQKQVPERDPELQDVLTSIAVRLAALDGLNGPERDAAYAEVEKLAAAHALSLFFEVQRLDALLT
jgi:hypothetical protein